MFDLGNGRGKTSVYKGKLNLPETITDQFEWFSRDFTAEMHADGAPADNAWYLQPDPATRHSNGNQTFIVVDDIGRVQTELKDGIAVPMRVNAGDLANQWKEGVNAEADAEQLRQQEQRIMDDGYKPTYDAPDDFMPPYVDPSEPSLPDTARDFQEQAQPMAVAGEPTSATSAPDRGVKLVQQIAEGEGTTDAQAQAKGFGSGYDVPYGYGKYGRPERPLTEMTVGNVRAFQRQQIAATKGKVAGTKLGTGAVGKYQVTFGTLNDVQKKLGFKDTDTFDAVLQDRIGRALL
ncbi:unnamed protein product, partial [marine sediment metagenome]